MSLRPDVSVVVCTRDRCADLGELLASLATQETTASWEVLVVDNGSHDGTPQAVAERVRSFPVPLRCVPEPVRGLSFARNRGLRAAAGEIVLWLDDDTRCRPGWLEAQASAFRDPSLLGSGGRILPVLPNDAPDWMRASARRLGGPASHFDLGDHPLDLGRGHPLPFGANMGTRRAAALELGGFRTDLGWGRECVPGEETELFRRLAALGPIRYVPEAVVEHRISRDRCELAYFARWHRGIGRSSVRLDPPVGFATRSARAAKASLRFSKWWLRGSWRGLKGDAGGRVEAIRRRAKHQGQLLELLRL